MLKIIFLYSSNKLKGMELQCILREIVTWFLKVQSLIILHNFIFIKVIYKRVLLHYQIAISNINKCFNYLCNENEYNLLEI